MSIIRTYDFYDFVCEFQNYDRADNFSEEALCYLFDWHDELPGNYELDVIGICCAWTEYDDGEDLWAEYSHLLGSRATHKWSAYEPDQYDEMLERLADNTNIAILDNGNVLVQEF